MPAWIDNHCHLDEEDDVAGLVAEACAEGVVGLITVGTDVRRSRAALDVARRHAGVWSTAGVHPHDATEGCDGLRELVADGTTDGTVVAIGECGFDFHYDHSPRDRQAAVFAEQVALAHETRLPLVIHTREAWEETFDLLDREGLPPRTVFHCFTGGPDEAAECLARGALLSLSGIVTFPSAGDLRAAAAAAPLDRVMVETDSPYLAPVPHRGRRNRPVHVARVGEEVALLMGRPTEEVAAATTATARSFYRLDEPAP